MELDIIEVRVYNYFAVGNQVKKMLQIDFKNIDSLLPQLKPIPITHLRLSRLNFASASNSERRWLQKFAGGIYFNFYTQKGDKLLLVINDDIKLPHIQYVHQLQNLYYDLTGDVLVIPKSKSKVQTNNPETGVPQTPLHKITGSGKYRTNKDSGNGKPIGEKK